MCRQVQGVLSHQPFGQIRIVGFKRFNDVKVIDNRLTETVAHTDGIGADGTDVNKDILNAYII